MAIDLTEETITAAVQGTFAGATDARLRELFVSLVQHLHDFARETRLTSEEWFTAVDFLERVGHLSSPTRQEFVLLSDILGLSVLVDRINHAHSSATESTLLGPFYTEGRPRAENGADISGGVTGMPLFFSGAVVDTEGRPVADAHVDTWHSDGEGFYDVQQADRLNGETAMRALLTTDADGRFWFRSIVPRYYPVPTDGPCGEIIHAAGRSPVRPGHIHFRLHANDYESLVTMLFRDDDPYLERDAVFGVKSSLVAEFLQHGAGETAPDGTEMSEPFQTVEWTFALAPDRR
ncbi:dioxygenase [Streptomyces sp. NPDC006012]|uniref:dioxygenase family protein n=1 Tax=Streptomyces sp. NPDC006012 TaxID=3364739 RepID=UPI0036A485BC